MNPKISGVEAKPNPHIYIIFCYSSIPTAVWTHVGSTQKDSWWCKETNKGKEAKLSSRKQGQQEVRMFYYL